MKQFSIPVIFLLLLANARGQDTPAAKGRIFRVPAGSAKNRLASQWKYHFEVMSDTTDKRTILPIATITFRRTQPVPATGTDKAWYPAMRFEIYTENDSVYCRRYGDGIHLLSSCIAPNAGGDRLSIGHFIFVNPDVCVNCAGQSGIDYCRSSILYFFKRITKRQTKNIYDLIEQLPIEEDR
jgi:hypothetical protein